MKTYLYLYTCLFVFLLQWMAGVSAGVHVAMTCCTTTTDTKYHPSEIIRYVRYRRPKCPINAVRFVTRFNKNVCSDPKSPWAKRVIKIVDGRNTTLPSSTSLPSSTTLPWSTVTPISPGLTTMTSTTLPVKITISTKVTNGPSSTDKETTYTKYPSVIMNKGPIATSKSTSTLRTSTRASTSQRTSMTSSMAAWSSGKKPVQHTSFTTMEPSRRTKELQSWTFTTRATKRGSTVDKGVKTSVVSLTPEMKTSVVKTSTAMKTSVVSLTPEMKTSVVKTSTAMKTSVVSLTPEMKTSTGMKTSVVSLTPETKKETQRVPVVSHTSTSSPRTTGQELLSRSGLIPRRTDSTTATLPSALTATTPHKPMELSTVAMVKPAQISKVTRLPWIHRRLKKKRKTGLRRAQKKSRR